MVNEMSMPSKLPTDSSDKTNKYSLLVVSLYNMMNGVIFTIEYLANSIGETHPSREKILEAHDTATELKEKIYNLYKGVA